LARLPVVVFLLCQLQQHILQLFRHRQSNDRAVLQDAQALIRQIEENHRSADGGPIPDHLGVHDVGKPHKDEDTGFLSDAFKPDLRGKLPAHSRGQKTGKIIQHHKDDQRVEEPVKPSPEPAKEPSKSRKRKFNFVDHILHNMLLSTHIRAIKQDGWFPSPPMVGIYLNTAYAVVFYSLYTMHMPRIPPLQGRISPYTDF